MLLDNGKYLKGAKRNWILVIQMHLIAIAVLIGYIVFGGKSDKQIVEIIAMVFVSSLFIQLLVYRVRPSWFRPKNDQGRNE